MYIYICIYIICGSKNVINHPPVIFSFIINKNSRILKWRYLPYKA